MGRHSMLVLLLAAAVLTSCGGTDAEIGGPHETRPASPTPPAARANSTPPSPRGHGDFSVSVAVGREDYGEGETISFTVEVCNQGSATTTEGWGGSDIPFSFSILDEQGQVVADDTHAVRTTELRIVPWGPGQCRDAQSTWDQQYWNRPEGRSSEPPEIHGTPRRGGTVPAGEYRIRISAALGTSTSVPFEIHR